MIWKSGTQEGKTIPYLFVDHELMASQDGFAGCMFPRNKLADAINRMAKDISLNYRHILSAEEGVWNRMSALWHAPREKGNFHESQQGVPPLRATSGARVNADVGLTPRTSLC